MSNFKNTYKNHAVKCSGVRSHSKRNNILPPPRARQNNSDINIFNLHGQCRQIIKMCNSSFKGLKEKKKEL